MTDKRASPDPRTRQVLRSTPTGHSNHYDLWLDCGHRVRRRLWFEPVRVICTVCQQAGGMGGNVFERTAA